MDGINIQVRDDPPRRRRGSGFGSAIMRLLFLAVMLIPTCIIAWRIDLVNPRQQQASLPQPPQQPTKLRQRQPPIVERKAQPQPSQRTSIEPLPRETEDGPLPRRIAPEPEPEPEPRPNQLVALSLEKPTQRQHITLSGDIKIVRVDGCDHSFKPPNGVPPVEITLDGPRPVTLSVSLDDRRNLIIEPTVKNDAGKAVPFTKKNLTRIHQRVIETGTVAATGLQTLKSERTQLQAWLKSPVLKTVPQYQAAATRITQLNLLITDAEKSVAALETEAKATQQLVQFAEKMHGECKLVVESSSE